MLETLGGLLCFLFVSWLALSSYTKYDSDSNTVGHKVATFAANCLGFCLCMIVFLFGLFLLYIGFSS